MCRQDTDFPALKKRKCNSIYLSLSTQTLATLYTARSIVSILCWRFGFSGNKLVSISEVTLRRARLVLECVTVSGVQLPVPENLFQYIKSHPGQLTLAIPQWVSVMSTSKKGGDALRLGSKGRWFVSAVRDGQAELS